MCANKFEIQSASIWQESGSLLLGSDERDAEQLRERAAVLNVEGVSAEFLDSRSLKAAEPALAVTPQMSGLLVATDTQIVRLLLILVLSLTIKAV